MADLLSSKKDVRRANHIFFRAFVNTQDIIKAPGGKGLAWDRIMADAVEEKININR